MLYRKVPECCKTCKFFDYDYNEFQDVTYYYCNLNVKFPTVKQACKRKASVIDGELKKIFK